MKALPLGAGKVDDISVEIEPEAEISVVASPAPAGGPTAASPRPKRSPAKPQADGVGAQPQPGGSAAKPRRASAATARRRVLSLEALAERYSVCTEDVTEFAAFLDVDPKKELYLLPTVCESITADLPAGWQECEDPKSGESYYWNRATDSTSWEHPLDAGFRKTIARLRRQQQGGDSSGDAANSSSSSSKAGSPATGRPEADMYKHGRDLLGTKQYSKAIAVFTAAIAVEHPEKALCFNLRGVCHSWLGNHQDALSDADHAVNLRPSATLYCNRGKAYRALKRFNEAKADLQKALELTPGNK
jgi:tetratricopeptide (TPR) repeat protein